MALTACASMWGPVHRVQEARALVSWSTSVLRELDVAATKKAVGKLIECQVSRQLGQGRWLTRGVVLCGAV